MPKMQLRHLASRSATSGLWITWSQTRVLTFKNELLNPLVEEAPNHHHLVTATCPWAKRSVERVCCEVLRASNAVLSEWNLSPMDWPGITEFMQSVLNHASLTRLRLRNSNTKGVYRTPLGVFTGHRSIGSLLRAMPISEYPTTVVRNELIIRNIIGIELIQHAADSMHHKLQKLTSVSCKHRTIAHKEMTRIVRPSFVVGDYVLVRQTRPGGRKLQFEGRGPRPVTTTMTKWTFEVENLLHGKPEVVHARRMLLYRQSLHGNPASQMLIEDSASLDRDY